MVKQFTPNLNNYFSMQAKFPVRVCTGSPVCVPKWLIKTSAIICMTRFLVPRVKSQQLARAGHKANSQNNQSTESFQFSHNVNFKLGTVGVYGIGHGG